MKGGSNVRYSVFEGMDRPGKACVIVNFGNEEETTEVTWPGGRELKSRFSPRSERIRWPHFQPSSAWRRAPARWWWGFAGNRPGIERPGKTPGKVGAAAWAAPRVVLPAVKALTVTGAAAVRREDQSFAPSAWANRLE